MEVSKYEFRSFEFGKPLPKGNHGKSDQARYAAFLQRKNTNTVKLECLEPYSNLRTLKFCHELNEVVGLLNSIQACFFDKFMHLRILDMSNSDLKLVPDSVSELIHLRFLGLSNTQITTLPENICDLFNLQTLFNVTSANGPCNISELNKLNLRGDLCIMNLEKVPTGQAITMSMPGGFPSLEHLKLLNLSSLKSLCLANEIPKLIQIYISDCPNLNRLVYHEDLHYKFQIEI